MSLKGLPHGIRACFFDLYNTLARFYPPREEVQERACREFGLQVSREALARGYALADAFMDRENSLRPLRLRSREEMALFFARYEQVLLWGAGVEVPLEVAGRIFQQVRQQPYGLALFEDVPEGLRALRERGLTLGVISNLDRPGPELLESLGLAGLVHFAVTSQEAGAGKPDRRIFLLALERAGVSPGEAVHTGDQVLSDVQGARAVGISPVLMDRYGVVDPAEVDCPVVHSLGELVDLLSP